MITRFVSVASNDLGHVTCCCPSSKKTEEWMCLGTPHSHIPSTCTTKAWEEFARWTVSSHVLQSAVRGKSYEVKCMVRDGHNSASVVKSAPWLHCLIWKKRLPIWSSLHWGYIVPPAGVSSTYLAYNGHPKPTRLDLCPCRKYSITSYVLLLATLSRLSTRP